MAIAKRFALKPNAMEENLIKEKPFKVFPEKNVSQKRQIYEKVKITFLFQLHENKFPLQVASKSFTKILIYLFVLFL